MRATVRPAVLLPGADQMFGCPFRWSLNTAVTVPLLDADDQTSEKTRYFGSMRP
jgi:hypothetical protein